MNSVHSFSRPARTDTDNLNEGFGLAQLISSLVWLDEPLKHGAATRDSFARGDWPSCSSLAYPDPGPVLSDLD
jgi:hypothetical protein